MGNAPKGQPSLWSNEKERLWLNFPLIRCDGSYKLFTVVNCVSNVRRIDRKIDLLQIIYDRRAFMILATRNLKAKWIKLNWTCLSALFFNAAFSASLKVLILYSESWRLNEASNSHCQSWRRVPWPLDRSQSNGTFSHFVFLILAALWPIL